MARAGSRGVGLPPPPCVFRIQIQNPDKSARTRVRTEDHTEEHAGVLEHDTREEVLHAQARVEYALVVPNGVRAADELGVVAAREGLLCYS